jgi:hypothetical protein
MRPVAAAGVLMLSAMAHAHAQRVEFDRSGYRLTSIGQRLTTTVRVTDASGRPVANAPMVFRVADPTIASVSTRGELVSKKTGVTRVWAVAGKDSGSAYVMVDQRAARFVFSPAVLRIDALRGTPVALAVQVSDSAGVPIPGATSASASCRSLDEGIAVLNGRSEIVARANGATYIRCTDRGFADSLRVEVRQRAVRTQILPARSMRKTVGDTFTVQMKAWDRSNDSVRAARPTWVSMDPKVVTVDPTSGRALAKAGGQTRLVAQLGDVADTATVGVDAPSGGGLLQAPAPVVDTTPVATAKRMQLRANALTLYEAETKQLTFSLTDTLGFTLPDPKVTIRSADTSIAVPLDSGMIKARKIGQVWAYVRYQGLVDSAIVTVRDSSKRAEEEARNGGDSVRTTVDEPTYAPGLAEKYQAERAALMDSIHGSGAFAPPSGKIWTAGIYAGLAAHSSNQENSATSKLIEDRSGVIYGGRTTLKPFSWMALSGDLRLGNLNTKGAIGEPLTVTEGVSDITFYLMPWLGLGGGYAVKYEKTKIAGQTWKIPHASITARSSFVGDIIATTTTFSVLPGASFTGMPDDQQPDIGLAGEAGLELRRASLDAGLTYYVERLPFPELRGRSRVDQFSSLRLRVGFKIGR